MGWVRGCGGRLVWGWNLREAPTTPKAGHGNGRAMREREARLLARVEERRRDVMGDVDRLSAEQLTYRPGPNRWSILDIVEHLVKVEEGVVSRVRPREPRTLAQAAQARSALVLMHVVTALRWRVKVPVQGVLPLGGVTLSDLASRWDDTQAALRERLEAFGPGDWPRPMMRHPLLGLLTPAEGLRFIHWHMGHHHRQIGRIRREPGYPRT